LAQPLELWWLVWALPPVLPVPSLNAFVQRRRR
jgi:hypothetical protein